MEPPPCIRGGRRYVQSTASSFALKTNRDSPTRSPRIWFSTTTSCSASPKVPSYLQGLATRAVWRYPGLSRTHAVDPHWPSRQRSPDDGFRSTRSTAATSRRLSNRPSTERANSWPACDTSRPRSSQTSQIRSRSTPRSSRSSRHSNRCLATSSPKWAPPTSTLATCSCEAE